MFPFLHHFQLDYLLLKQIFLIVSFYQTQNPNQNSQKSYTNVDVHYLCEKCDLGIEKNMQYILLDLRILEYSEDDDETDKTGFVPSMISVSQEELK